MKRRSTQQAPSVISTAGRLSALVLVAGLLATLTVARASDPGMSGFELRGVVDAGAPLFQQHCADCHGTRGTGDGRQGAAFGLVLRDFTAVEADAERYYLATRDGGMAVGLSAAMPMFRHTLSDDEIRDVVAYLVQLAPRGPRGKSTAPSPQDDQR